MPRKAASATLTYPTSPESFLGAEAIYERFSGLTQYSGRCASRAPFMVPDDPNFFVDLIGDTEILAEGRYQNDYLGTWRNGQVVEYTDYFNPLVMARVFNIPFKQPP